MVKQNNETYLFPSFVLALIDILNITPKENYNIDDEENERITSVCLKDLPFLKLEIKCPHLVKSIDSQLKKARCKWFKGRRNCTVNIDWNKWVFSDESQMVIG